MDKVLLIILDGLADRQIDSFGGKTPLEQANKPYLNLLAKEGVTGLMYPVDIGIRPGSDIAHLSIFGYDLDKYYMGRGPLEALGIGIDLKEGDVAMRGNFATIDNNFNIIDRRAGRVENTHDFVKLLSGTFIDNIKIIVKVGVGHRVAVVLNGKGLDGRISDTDPHEVNVRILKSKPIVNNSNTLKTSTVINKFTKKVYQILSNHKKNKERVKKGIYPANILLLRGAGSVSQIPDFREKYGFKSACIAGAGLYKGIGKSIGMKVLRVSRTTGKPDTNIKNKISKALEAFRIYNFVFLHIKGCDVLAEDGNHFAKKEFIEKIDQALRPLIKRKDILKVITADHTTSSYLKKHTSDPVPIIFAGRNLFKDKVMSFDEISCSRGYLGRIKGKDVMPVIINFLGKSPLSGG